MDEKQKRSIEIQLVEIENMQCRMMKHQDDHKLAVEKIFNRLDYFNDLYHNLDKKIMEGDNTVRHECEQSNKDLTRSVATFGISTVVILISGIIGYLAYKL